MKLKEALRRAWDEGQKEGFEPLADWLDRITPRLTWDECGPAVLQALGWSGLLIGGAILLAALSRALGCP